MSRFKPSLLSPAPVSPFQPYEPAVAGVPAAVAAQDRDALRSRRGLHLEEQSAFVIAPPGFDFDFSTVRSARDLYRMFSRYHRVETTEQAESAHAHLRRWLATRYNPQIAADTRILYGGSVKPQNAMSLLEQPNVDGALVGGASLKLDDFLLIIRAAESVNKS